MLVKVVDNVVVELAVKAVVKLVVKVVVKEVVKAGEETSFLGEADHGRVDDIALGRHVVECPCVPTPSAFFFLTPGVQ